MRWSLAASALIGACLWQEAWPANWQTIGVGNASCQYWSKAGAPQKLEVLGWMTGFTSAINLGFASNGQKEFRMELMTYEYLRRELDAQCSKAGEKYESLSDVLVAILKDFPRQQ